MFVGWFEKETSEKSRSADETAQAGSALFSLPTSLGKTFAFLSFHFEPENTTDETTNFSLLLNRMKGGVGEGYEGGERVV